MHTYPQHIAMQGADLRDLVGQIEAAALNAQTLLRVANRELLEDVERGLTLVAAAERYVADVIVINQRLCAVSAQTSHQKQQSHPVFSAPDGPLRPKPLEKANGES